MLTLSTSPARCWDYSVQQDAFDGAKEEVIKGLSRDGSAALFIYAGRGGTINNEGVNIALVPGAQFICNSSPNDMQFVEWMIVDKSGAEIDREYFTTWEVTNDRRTLFIGNARSRNSGKYESRDLIDYMLQGAEARFRFSDDCGEKYVSIFSLDDLPQAVAKLNAPE